MESHRTAESGAPESDRPSRARPTAAIRTRKTFWKATYRASGLPNIPSPPSSPPAPLLLLLDLCPQAIFLGPQLRRDLRAEVLVLEHGPDLDHRLVARGVGAALDPLHRFVHRRDLPDPEAGDELLRLREGPVQDLPVLPREEDSLPLRARVETLP